MQTHSKIDLPCVILAGGKSLRFGSDKAFAQVNGQRLIDLVIERLETQTSGLIIINAAAPDAQDICGKVTVSDYLRGEFGPLGGLHTAMKWANDLGFDRVVTTPVDTPLLPPDFIARLVEAGAPAIARSTSGRHPLHGLWPTRLHEFLESRILDGIRAARAWAAACNASEALFLDQNGTDPFFNVNTLADLDHLNEIDHNRRG